VRGFAENAQMPGRLAHSRPPRTSVCAYDTFGETGGASLRSG